MRFFSRVCCDYIPKGVLHHAQTLSVKSAILPDSRRLRAQLSSPSAFPSVTEYYKASI